jgi:hypothetical protein
MAAAGSGISVAPLNRLDPGVSISGPDAGRQELADYLARSLTDGLVTGKGGTIITTEQGQRSLSDRGIPSAVADLAGSLFYKAPESTDPNQVFDG